MKLPATAPKRRLPPLPLASPSTETRAYWRTLWSSPMAAVWLDADVPALVRLARLVDLVNRGEAAAAVLAEIRQLEDRFGLSPLSRRRLLWELEQTSEAAPTTQAAGDEARWLRAVSD